MPRIDDWLRDARLPSGRIRHRARDCFPPGLQAAPATGSIGPEVAMTAGIYAHNFGDERRGWNWAAEEADPRLETFGDLSCLRF